MRDSLDQLRQFEVLDPLDSYVKLFQHAKDWNRNNAVINLIDDFNVVRSIHPAKEALSELQQLFGTLSDLDNTDPHNSSVRDDQIHLRTDLTGTAIDTHVAHWKDGDGGFLETHEYVSVVAKIGNDRAQAIRLSTFRDVATLHAEDFVGSFVDKATKELDYILKDVKARRQARPGCALGS
ncbi:MAG: hypothetical protein AAF569_02085 [Pseudomonadota bacterium]